MVPQRRPGLLIERVVMPTVRCGFCGRNVAVTDSQLEIPLSCPACQALLTIGEQPHAISQPSRSSSRRSSSAGGMGVVIFIVAIILTIVGIVNRRPAQSVPTGREREAAIVRETLTKHTSRTPSNAEL